MTREVDSPVLTVLYYLIALYIFGIVVWIVVDSPDWRRKLDGAMLYVPLLLRLLQWK